MQSEFFSRLAVRQPLTDRRSYATHCSCCTDEKQERWARGFPPNEHRGRIAVRSRPRPIHHASSLSIHPSFFFYSYLSPSLLFASPSPVGWVIISLFELTVEHSLFRLALKWPKKWSVPLYFDSSADYQARTHCRVVYLTVLICLNNIFYFTSRSFFGPLLEIFM